MRTQVAVTTNITQILPADPIRSEVVLQPRGASFDLFLYGDTGTNGQGILVASNESVFLRGESAKKAISGIVGSSTVSVNVLYA